MPSIFSWMCLTEKTLSLALWNCYEERLWLTFVLMRKNREDIHGILQITFKNEKDRTHAKTVIEANTDYHVVIA